MPGPMSTQQYSTAISPSVQGWIVLAIFGIGFLFLLLFGHFGASLDAGFGK